LVGIDQRAGGRGQTMTTAKAMLTRFLLVVIVALLGWGYLG
jgi:hypothetical protein